ncbi:MAG: helix-turn-helix transcriptional regulator [Gammaproteobacteria bacterium]|nr:helix-turn-helix transcriptional regulator [Gammaproteobacteria bacterium]
MEKKQALEVLTGLSQETRLDIFRLLVERGPEGQPAGKIGDRLGLPAATLSFHLAHLERCGLLDAEKAGRSIIYSANFEAMTALMAFLSENCCRESACCAPGKMDPPMHGGPRARRSRSHETTARPRSGR